MGLRIGASNPAPIVDVLEMENYAAWFRGIGKELELGPAQMPKPGAGEIVVQVQSVTSLLLALLRTK